MSLLRPVLQPVMRPVMTAVTDARRAGGGAPSEDYLVTENAAQVTENAENVTENGP